MTGEVSSATIGELVIQGSDALTNSTQWEAETGAVVSLVEGLTTAIDSTPLAADTLNGGVLTLEHNLSFPQPGLGRLQSFTVPTTTPVTNSACLASPSGMLLDRISDRLVLTELNTGWLVWLPVPLSLSQGETWI